jgi:predicted nucleic acid-binding protein
MIRGMSFMTEILIDSNILVYAHDATDPKKHSIAKDIVAKLLLSGEGVVSIQNLSEFSRAITEKAKTPLTHSEVRNIVLEFDDALRVVAYNGHTVAEALLFASKYDLHFYDSLLAATMELHHINEIITEDEGFSKIPWIKMRNPFKS